MLTYHLTDIVMWQKAGASTNASSEDRVRAGAAKLAKMLQAKQQGRLDGFFTVKPKEATAGAAKAGDKRKADAKKGAPAKKGKK